MGEGQKAVHFSLSTFHAQVYGIDSPSGHSSIFHTCHGGSRNVHCRSMPSVAFGLRKRCMAQTAAQWEGIRYVGIGIGDKELAQQVLENNFYCTALVFCTVSRENANYQSSPTTIVRKDVTRVDLTSSQVNFLLWASSAQMQVGQGNQLAHGHPGTPVSDLFFFGNAVLGNGNSLRPIRAGELRNHSADGKGREKGA